MNHPAEKTLFHFGTQLDGWRACLPRLRLNEMTGGLAALLDQLELRLGVPHSKASYVSRVTHYADALSEAQRQHPRFYAASLKKNALATAEMLLRWRDDLVMGGWMGQASHGFSVRLNDLAAVELLASQEVRSGDGDRIRVIQEVLDAGVVAPLDVVVMGGKASLPGRLVCLLDKLDAKFQEMPSFMLGDKNTNLRRGQDALLGSSMSIDWNPNDDDTLVLCTAFSEMTLAQAAAQWMTDSSVSRAVLATSSLSALSAAVRGLDKPAPGWNAISAERPILQFLRLALRLRWQPLDPKHLLEFLVHPVSPLPSRLRYGLASALAEKPGIASSEWNDAVQKAKALASSSDAEKATGEESGIDTKMKEWILISRYDPLDGADGSQLNETCERVKDWALRRSAVEKCGATTHLWQKLASVAGELGSVFGRKSKVPLHEVDHLLMLAEGQGASREHAMAELGSVPIWNDPSAVLESVDEIFWWFAEKPAPPPITVWTRFEIEALSSHGVHLVPTEAVIQARHRAAMQPLLAAKQRVRLFLPQVRGGDSIKHHPLLDELRVLASGKPVPRCDLDVAIASEKTMPGILKHTRKPLPALRRWWTMRQPELLQARSQESYSSLHLLVRQPFAWVLQYGARLREGAVGSFTIVADSRQRGNLLHRVTEKLFSDECGIDWKSVSREAFNIWMESEWRTLLETEGANLLLPGARSDAEQLRQQGLRVIWQLIEQLRSAGVIEATADVKPQGAPFRQNALVTGRVDLLIKRAGSPSTAVVDLKLGGRGVRRAELEQNSALQLAVYAYLLAASNGGEWPMTAFFILNDGIMLAPKGDGFFPGSTEVGVKNATPGPKACWNDFLGVWDWRRAQLDQGLIEVPVAGAALTATDPLAPDPRWQPDPDEFRQDIYQALTGWRTDA